ncbi:MAG TPA: ergothioneine biosynthesis protein EgtB [Burkholderiaceae bacterium]|nr:ergothioneine biosynthesis protein EgtB [Burkholderiaceae bacterium]
MSAQADHATSAQAALLRQRYCSVRERTEAIAAPLSAEDCCAQSMPDASPVKWHLAHTAWFFETFILERYLPGFRAFHPAFRMLFNSYYNGVGEKHPRPQRGLLTRPSLAEVTAYRRSVDERMLALLARTGAAGELAALTELGLQHEQQHQELMLTDVKHLLSMNPLKPAYADAPSIRYDAAEPDAGAPGWVAFDARIAGIGHEGAGFCFDNELPRHRQFIEPFMLASRLVTNRDYLAFIDAGGYRNPALWLSEGWDWVCADQLAQPLYWRHAASASTGKWEEFTLQGMQPLDARLPATHLSYFEADAYARWAGARLPTEAEWECAAMASTGLAQLFGACWQWTSSSYAPYPGYVAAAGAVGEYNGKFMVNQYVLRGSSYVTPAGHARASYRNFFPAAARWQCSGIRLATSGNG